MNAGTALTVPCGMCVGSPHCNGHSSQSIGRLIGREVAFLENAISDTMRNHDMIQSRISLIFSPLNQQGVDLFIKRYYEGRAIPLCYQIMLEWLDKYKLLLAAHLEYAADLDRLRKDLLLVDIQRREVLDGTLPPQDFYLQIGDQHLVFACRNY